MHQQERPLLLAILRSLTLADVEGPSCLDLDAVDVRPGTWGTIVLGNTHQVKPTVERMRSMLLKPGWIITHVAVVAIAVAFINLGLWQLQRRTEVSADNARVAAVIEASPVPLTTALLDDPTEFRPVTVEGTFVQQADVSLSPRSRNGRPGFEVLTPLRLAADPATTVLVNRGWVPLDESVPPPPVEPTTIRARLQLSRDARQVLADDDGAVETLTSVDLDELLPQIEGLTGPAYVDVVDEDARQAGVIPRPADPPSLESGNHLSYALQWFAFTVIGLVGYPLLLKRRMDDADVPVAAGSSGTAEPAAAS